MPRRIKLGTKLAVVGALAVGAVGVSTYAGWSALAAGGDDSPAVRQSIQYERLIADVLPTPQYLVEPYLVEYRALRETRPAQRAELLNRIRLERTTYDQKHAEWVKNLSADPVLAGETELRQALLEDSYVPAQAFWQQTFDVFVPALEAGRTAEAAAALDGPITDAFAQHRAAIDNVVTLATSRRDAHAASVAAAASGRRTTLLVVAGVAAAVLAALVALVARSVKRPLQKLADAMSDARDELGRAVATIEHSRPDSPQPEVTPLGFDGDDDLAIAAHAFESVRHTALELATKSATSRRSVGELFVNLGRRNQALINRQLSFIDQLERGEEDPDTLADLFRLDHLATRMRRNAESLLVLAGAEQSRRWTESVDVSQVVRSALSEIEEYTQVDLADIEPVLVRGGVVADLAHLLAELLENATSFSPPTSRVVVTGRMLPDGYVVSIIDEGIGMDAAALAEANRRIESVARRDAPSARVLGLHVVGCLAARHTIRVRLVASTGQGVTARVLLPPATIEPSRAPQSPIQAVAAAASSTFERALSRFDDGDATAEPGPLPSRRARGPVPPPEPERFDPWPAAPPAVAPPAVAPPPAADAPQAFGDAPSYLDESPSYVDDARRAFDDAPSFVDHRAALVDDAPADDEPVVDPWFAADLSDAIRATFDADAGADAADDAADDVWPPVAATTFEPEPPLPPLPADAIVEPPLPWRSPSGPEPATFRSWRPDDEAAEPQAPPAPALAAPLDPPAPGAMVTDDAFADDAFADDGGVPGLARRVRGAQLPDLGPARRDDGDVPRRSADDVRSQLSRFRAGVERGRAEERRTPNPDEGDRS